MFLAYGHIIFAMDRARRARAKSPVRPVRSEEQILADLERRVAEMRREASLPVNALRCSDCEFQRKHHCHNPLVIGLGAPVWLNSEATDLCGPERALWRPRRTVWQRLADWLAR